MKTTFKMTLAALACSLLAPTVHADPVVYQWPDVYQSQSAPLMMHKTSTQYWQTVTGKDLKKGLAVYVSQQDNLVRIAPKARFQNGEVFSSPSLDQQQLKVINAPEHAQRGFTPLAAQKEMELAGFADGSIAIKLGQGAQNKAPVLRTNQAIGDMDLYLVHVIEKNSPYALDAASARSYSNTDQGLAFELSMQGQKVPQSNVSLRLISPEGEKVTVSNLGGELQFSKQLEYLGASKGFYEIEATARMNVDGKKIVRSVKLPFVNSVKTVALTRTEITSQTPQRVDAKVTLQPHEQGRYSVRATLEGKVNGKRAKIATVEAADNLEGTATLTLPFNVSKGVSGPFRLVDVTLTDQTRMLKFTADQTPAADKFNL